MENNDLVRLKHMLDSAQAILSFLKGKKRASLDSDRMLASAVSRELEIIGEAAGKISEKTRKKFPKLPWSQLIGMRNRLIHAYFDVNHDTVWDTVKNEIPKLVTELEKIVKG